MLDISLKQLEVFEAVAQHKSFTVAAEKLYLSQSTISSHVNLLEQALGVQLFLRASRKKVELTEDGQRLSFPVPEEMYDGFEKGQTGTLTLIDGQLYGFEPES